MQMSKKGVCVHCGYMKNGVIIDTKKKQYATLLEFYFGTKYDKFIRNRNYLVAGIFGPIYIMANNHFFIGLLLCIIDTLITLLFYVFNHAFLFTYIVWYLNFVYFIFNRFVWATIGNIIYIKLLVKKLEKIKNKNPDSYVSLIEDKYKKDHTLIVFKYITFGIIYYIIFTLIKIAVYDAFGIF